MFFQAKFKVNSPPFIFCSTTEALTLPCILASIQWPKGTINTCLINFKKKNHTWHLKRFTGNLEGKGAWRPNCKESIWKLSSISWRFGVVGGGGGVQTKKTSLWGGYEYFSYEMTLNMFKGVHVVFIVLQ